MYVKATEGLVQQRVSKTLRVFAYTQTVMGKFKKPRRAAKANGLITQCDKKEYY